VPHVASDFNAIHASSHHAGARPRAARAEAREATSPFSELVDAKAAEPAPPSAGDRRSDQAPVKADDAAPVKDSAADTTSKAPADKARADDETAEAAPPADGSETKDPADVAVAVQLALATAAAGAGAETDTDAAESKETETDDKTAEADSTDTTATLAVDTTTTPVATEPKTFEPTVAPVAAAIAAPIEASAADQTEPAADDAAAAAAGAIGARSGSTAAPVGGDDETAQGAAKGRSRKTAAAGVKHADDSQPAKGATKAADAQTAEPETAAPKAGGQEGEREGGHDGDGTSAQPPKGEHAHHVSAARHETPKPDAAAGQPLGQAVSDAAQNARPPSEAVHTVLQANDRASGVAVSAQAPAADAQSVPLAGLAVEIAARAQAGHSRFEIRLDPPELGRIDVRLDVDQNGNVTSRLLVDRAETLDVLRRDVHTLERALQDAGLKTSDNGLQFSLRDQGFAGRDGSEQRQGSARLVVPDPDLAPVETRATAYGRLFGSNGGVDIRV
jgi:flagellar hook-length control protein FliK